MILFSIIFLLSLNAVTIRRDISLLFSRNTIIILLTASWWALQALYPDILEKDVNLFGELFHTLLIILSLFLYLSINKWYATSVIYKPITQICRFFSDKLKLQFQIYSFRFAQYIIFFYQSEYKISIETLKTNRHAPLNITLIVNTTFIFNMYIPNQLFKIAQILALIIYIT